MIKPSCPFDDCRSTEIKPLDGGVQTLAVMMHKGRLYDGNQTALCFKCLKCGEAFVLHHHIDILDEEVIKAILATPVDEPFDPYPNRAPEELKKRGKHLP